VNREAETVETPITNHIKFCFHKAQGGFNKQQGATRRKRRCSLFT
jgi:hypothetical protein